MKVNTLMTDGGNTAKTNLPPLSSSLVEESWKNGNTFNYLDPTNGGISNSTTTVGVNNNNNSNNSNNSNTSTTPAKTTLSSVSSNSYGDSLYMDERAVDESIEIINELSHKFYEVFSDLLLVEDSLRKKGEASGWWSVSSNFAPDLFYNHKFLSLADSGNVDSEYPANKLLSIYHGDEGVSNFFKQPSFNGLISSLEEIKQAILNYSNGVDTDNALSILRSWIGPSFNLPAKISFGSGGNTGIVSSNANPVTAPPISSTGIGNKTSSNIMDSEVVDFDKDDGADNIKVKDSATDDITNVSSDKLIKDSSSVAIPGVASIIGSSTRNGSLAGAVGVGAGILGLNGDAPLEMLDTNADEIDGSDMAGSVSDAISDFITPDVGTAKGKVVKSSTGASAIAATLAGVGALSAGAVGGKIYMDKKKSEDDDDDDMVSYDDDDFFDREEENEEEPIDTSIVDFKNEILNDNL